jgi:hypothetical protein
MEEPTKITRSTDKGDLTTTTVKNIPNLGFRAQSIRQMTENNLGLVKKNSHSTFILVQI